MERFSTLEKSSELSSKRQIAFLLYLGIIGVITHYVYPSESIFIVKHSKPLKLHDSVRSPNYMVEGDNLIYEDNAIEYVDSVKTSQLIILFAGLIYSYLYGINHGKSKRSINFSLYDSTLEYSPLRSPPPIKQANPNQDFRTRFITASLRADVIFTTKI
jgi:hypothetical protein